MPKETENQQEANQRSAVWSYGFSKTSSGDMYSGVPCIHNTQTLL